jgi:hypothetical protein
MCKPPDNNRPILSKSLIPDKDIISATSSQNDLTTRSNKSANISKDARNKRKKFSYLNYAEKREKAEKERIERKKTPKKGSLYLEILAKKKENRTKKSKKRTHIFKKEKQKEEVFFYEDSNPMKDHNKLSKSQIEEEREENNEKEENRLVKTEVIQVKVDFEEKKKDDLKESGNIIDKLKTQIKKQSRSNLLKAEDEEEDLVIKDAMDFVNRKKRGNSNKVSKKNQRKSKRKDHLNSKKISMQIEQALKPEVKAKQTISKKEKKKSIEPVKIEIPKTKNRIRPPLNSPLASQEINILEIPNLNEDQKIKNKIKEEPEIEPNAKILVEKESIPHDLKIEQKVERKRESVPKESKKIGSRTRMTLKQIRQAYKSKKEKRDKSHNKADLIKETINSSRIQTQSERQTIPLLTESEIQMDKEGNYIVPKKLFEKISQTQHHLKNLIPNDIQKKKETNWKSCSKESSDFESNRLTYSEIQNRIEATHEIRESESNMSLSRPPMNSEFNRNSRQHSYRHENLPDPENPFDPPKKKLPPRIQRHHIPNKINFQRKKKPEMMTRNYNEEPSRGRPRGNKNEYENHKNPQEKVEEEMYGSQPIVLNNNFVNYNYYINDIRQSNFGSQTQKISTKRKNPSKMENVRKKNHRVKSEVNKSRSGMKGGLSKLSDEEKLKYFEKYKKKFGVNYKAELHKRRNSEANRSQMTKERKNKRKHTRATYGNRDTLISEMDIEKSKIISQRDTRKGPANTPMKVKSYRKNTNRAKKKKENFIKRNMKLIREAKKKAERKLPKAMKTGELRGDKSNSKYSRIEHKKSKSQIVSRRNEKRKDNLKKKNNLNDKAVVKGKVNMGIIMKRMEKEKIKSEKYANESKYSDNKSKNESFISKGSQNRTFLSRSPISKKKIDNSAVYKTMGTVMEKKETKKKTKKKYILSSMKERQRAEMAKKKKEEAEKEKERIKKEKRDRKEVTKIVNSYLRSKPETKGKPKEVKAKVNKRGLNKSGMLPKNEQNKKKRGGPKSYDPFIGNSKTEEKKGSKKTVLFSDLRGIVD